ncbi:uncharacterized protein LOC124640127 isoform X2 [Helicoverpa zea]|uniref:uncharacterized protein LOC124640127 isoform X2 n=1 Tax=Helicoverpa zea TaxID=7113 RepID=UPI001F55B26C|nr:uncharacterized protein LOC124640127 isoform X2 [Helicoverpa zea]
MEREYAAACRRLSGDWRALERGWGQRRRALRCRQRELAARSLRLAALTDTHRTAAEGEEGRVAALRSRVDSKKATLQEYVASSVKQLLDSGCKLDESSTPSPDSPASETSTESLMHLLQQCEPKVASSIKETVERHKKELVELEEELQTRVASVASHRVKIERLQAELALLGTQELGLKHALASDLAPNAARGVDGESDASPLEGVKRSKSELVLRRTPREDVMEPLSADEREDYRLKRVNLSLSLDPLASPNSTLNTEETFHTATSSPKKFPEWGEGDAATEPAVPRPATNFRLGPVPNADDSDDMSSTEDYHKPRIVEGQSSSSVERSPEERHQRAKYKRRVPGEGKPGRRQVTEVEALRAMQRLCSRIASQKMLVISSLENDCSKEELNRQIAVLQELQKKYVRLEMALQYSFFDNQSRRPMMVTPIQETPSLTLSESDMQVATDDDVTENGHVRDPLLHRLKEQELEGSDNVSTSNDELPSESHEPAWEDPLRCRVRPDRLERSERSDRLERSDRSDRLERSDRIERLERRELSNHDLSLPDPTISPGLSHPIDFNEVVHIPGWVTRGAGARTHQEYEVRVVLGAHCRWLLLRRYRRFRDLCLSMRRLYGPKVQCCTAAAVRSTRCAWCWARTAAGCCCAATAASATSASACAASTVPRYSAALQLQSGVRGARGAGRALPLAAAAPLPPLPRPLPQHAPPLRSQGTVLHCSCSQEYEVRVVLGAHCRWLLLRRYRRFRDLCLSMRRLYGPKVQCCTAAAVRSTRCAWCWARTAAGCCCAATAASATSASACAASTVPRYSAALQLQSGVRGARGAGRALPLAAAAPLPPLPRPLPQHAPPLRSQGTVLHCSCSQEYEVRVVLGAHCRWLLLRRYRRFRDLCLSMRRLYGPKVQCCTAAAVRSTRCAWCWARTAAGCCCAATAASATSASACAASTVPRYSAALQLQSGVRGARGAGRALPLAAAAPLPPLPRPLPQHAPPLRSQGTVLHCSCSQEYEVRVVLGAHCRWLLLRRYRRFRDLCLSMRRLYGPKVQCCTAAAVRSTRCAWCWARTAAGCCCAATAASATSASACAASTVPRYSAALQLQSGVRGARGAGRALPLAAAAPLPPLPRPLPQHAPPLRSQGGGDPVPGAHAVGGRGGVPRAAGGAGAVAAAPAGRRRRRPALPLPPARPPAHARRPRQLLAFLPQGRVRERQVRHGMMAGAARHVGGAGDCSHRAAARAARRGRAAAALRRAAGAAAVPRCYAPLTVRTRYCPRPRCK